MKKNYLTLGIISLLAVSCTHDEFEIGSNEAIENEDVKLVYDNSIPILHFSSASVFFKTYNDLLNQTKQEQDNWATSKNPKALLANVEECADSLMLTMPNAYKALFNQQLRVNINDSVMEYKDGNLFLVSLKGKEINDPIICGEGTSSILEIPQIQTRQTGEIGFGNLGMSHQHEFTKPNSKYSFKYVHELISFQTRVNNVVCEIISLYIKLEYRGKGSWKPAGETRDIDVNLKGGALLKWSPSSAMIPVTQFNYKNGAKFRSVQGVIEVPISRVDYTSQLDMHVWAVDLVGSITHTVCDSNETSRWNDQW